jgi:hypothetical protein
MSSSSSAVKHDVSLLTLGALQLECEGERVPAQPAILCQQRSAGDEIFECEGVRL